MDFTNQRLHEFRTKNNVYDSNGSIRRNTMNFQCFEALNLIVHAEMSSFEFFLRELTATSIIFNRDMRHIHHVWQIANDKQYILHKHMYRFNVQTNTAVNINVNGILR